MTSEGKDESRLRKDSAKSVVFPGHKKESDSSEGESPRVNRKFIENWRHACDRTKDRTKELLKKWRTLPEPDDEMSVSEATEGTGWSEHVWATWVKRCPSGDGTLDNESPSFELTPIQKEKFANFFIHLLDMDSDEVISLFDIENLFERFRHFADWSRNSPEYHRLLEVQKGFVETFLYTTEMNEQSLSYPQGLLEKALRKEQLEIDGWLEKWRQVLSEAKNYQQLPLWLQYFPTILFQVINKSGSGSISPEELLTFYTSIVGISEQKVSTAAPIVFNILTSNGEYKLDAHVYRLSFANMLFGRYPNGPGQWLLYPLTKADAMFPVDYRAMCSAQRDLEQYSPAVKTDRRSVIV